MSTLLERFHAAEVRWVELGSARVAYRVFGSGDPLVFVHGWPVSGSTWRGMVDVLKDHFTCYVLDLPGAGSSPVDPSIKEFFSELGSVVRRFVEALELEQVGLIGFDSGGTVARVAAAELGPRVTAIALTNTETPGHEIPLVRALQVAAAVPGAALLFRWLLHSRAYVRSKNGFGGLFQDRDLLDGEFHQASIVPLQKNVSGALTMLRRCDLKFVHRLAEIHAQIEAPLLCVWGDRDPFFPIAGAKQMVDAWPVQARLETVPGRKLFVHEESAQEVAALMAPFLAEQFEARTIRRVPA